MNDINEILKECAEAEGLRTYMYVRQGEANVLMDHVTQFPAMMRQFNETISETGIDGEERRTGRFYFFDSLGEVDADTETEVAPITERMKNVARSFVNRLRGMGVKVDRVTDITPYEAMFDSLVAGCYATITMTYNIC